MNLKSRKINRDQQESDDKFMQQLEQSLLQPEQSEFTQAVEQFEQIYQRKKQINQCYDQEHQRNSQGKRVINQMKQRMNILEQQTERNSKMAGQLKQQFDRVTDAHAVSKILLMEKLITAHQEKENMIKKKKHYFRIRADKNRASIIRKSNSQYRQNRIREISLMQTKAMREYKTELIEESKDLRRQQADQIRFQKQRCRNKMRRIEEYKLEQNRRNYEQKAQQMQLNLQKQTRLLGTLCAEEQRLEQRLDETYKINSKYSSNLFATETI